MIHKYSSVITAAFIFLGLGSVSFAGEKLYSGEPIRALLITGGCCHNYAFQAQAMTEGISRKADVQWKVVHEGGTGTRAQIDLYQNPDWAKPYDVVIHNECFADTTDPEYIRKITGAHQKGTPAVVIHRAIPNSTTIAVPIRARTSNAAVKGPNSRTTTVTMMLPA